jgi:hypothetical protein
MCAGGSTQGVKRPGLEADLHLQLVPRLMRVEIDLHHPYLFMELCLIKHTDNILCFTSVIEFIHRVYVRYHTIDWL